MFSYKNNRIEAVVFVFYKDGKVLIENRPSGPDHLGPNTNFFPSGKIDAKDHDSDEDYRHVALKREVSEELNNAISFTDYHYLGEMEVDPINIHFYVYLITDFEGTLPEYALEEGEKFAKLFWIDMKDKKEHFVYDSAFQICDMVENFLTRACFQINGRADYGRFFPGKAVREEGHSWRLDRRGNVFPREKAP